MSSMLAKMAPTAVVAVLVVWCCWPYLEAPRQDQALQHDDDSPRIAGSLLSPAVEPAPDRDPFQPPPTKQPPLTKQEEPVAIPRPAEPPAENPQPAEEEETAKPLDDLVLRAIYIQGDRRVALINDQVCAQGDLLVTSPTSTDPCVVAEITAERVRLLHRGQTVELKYAEPASGAKPAADLEPRHD